MTRVWSRSFSWRRPLTSSSICRALQVTFADGSQTDWVEVEYPVGHRRRRAEGIPLLIRKFEGAVRGHFSAEQAERILAACSDLESLDNMPVPAFVDLFVVA